MSTAVGCKFRYVNVCNSLFAAALQKNKNPLFSQPRMNIPVCPSFFFSLSKL
jgi:hypothetical protein